MQPIDPKILHKKVGSSIQSGAARTIAFAGDADEVFFEQALDAVVAAYPANGLEFGFGNRLFVGYDAEGFERGGREALFRTFGQRQAEQIVEIGFGVKGITSTCRAQFKSAVLAGDVGREFLHNDSHVAFI